MFSGRTGFTLVEVLVVIAIIGVLVALLLPAVEMARESSRRSSCANNLRQLAIAVKLHADTHQTFPTGGWGGDWLGDPDAGYGTKQPGGWIYNILAYIEEDALRQLGRGLKDVPRDEALTKLMESPLEVLHCPSRRLPRLFPYTSVELKNARPPEKVAKTDYAISKTISFLKSEVIPSDVQLRGKGMSKTALVGEKSLAAANYTDGMGAGDTLLAYVGDSDDIRRELIGPPVTGGMSDGRLGAPRTVSDGDLTGKIVVRQQPAVKQAQFDKSYNRLDDLHITIYEYIRFCIRLLAASHLETGPVLIPKFSTASG